MKAQAASSMGEQLDFLDTLKQEQSAESSRAIEQEIRQLLAQLLLGILLAEIPSKQKEQADAIKNYS